MKDDSTDSAVDRLMADLVCVGNTDVSKAEVEALLCGGLPADEAEAIQARLQTDPEAAAEVERQEKLCSELRHPAVQDKFLVDLQAEIVQANRAKHTKIVSMPMGGPLVFSEKQESNMAMDVRRVEDKNRDDVRWAASSAAGKLRGEAPDPGILSALATQLGDRNDAVRLFASNAVRKLGGAAASPHFLAALGRLLMDRDFGVRESACDVAGSLGEGAATPQILAAVTRLLTDPDEDVRQSAERTLSRLSTKPDNKERK